MSNYNITAKLFDRDGDGTSAAVIGWINQSKEGEIIITNNQKNERGIVKKIFEHPDYNKITQVEVYDLGLEDNIESVKTLLDRGVKVKYFDHHKNQRTPEIPEGLESYIMKDERDNCAATIVFNWAKENNLLKNSSQLLKATQLTIIGLANDAKGRASENFGGDLIEIPERKDLIKYAKGLNFGAAAGKGNIIEIYNGLVNSKKPVDYLRESEETNNLVKERDDALVYIRNNSNIISPKEKKVKIYEFPSETEWDRELSNIAYNELMNTLMEETNENIIHIGVVETPEGSYTISVRNNGKKAYEIANRIAGLYGIEAKGRKTAAGTTIKGLERGNLLEKILEIV